MSRSIFGRRELIAATCALPALSLPALGCTAGTRQEPRAEGGGDREATPLDATVILVRHAEKAEDGTGDPPLSDAGTARAEALARMLGAAGVTALVHTELRRTRDTLTPLARALELDTETIGARDAAELRERLRRAKADEIVVVSGHSNTIPEIAWAFGVLLPGLEEPEFGPKRPFGFLPHGAYDRLHVLQPGSKSARLLELRYGA